MVCVVCVSSTLYVGVRTYLVFISSSTLNGEKFSIACAHVIWSSGGGTSAR